MKIYSFRYTASLACGILLSLFAVHSVQANTAGEQACSGQFQDLNGDGKPDQVLLTGCNYAGGQDTVLVFDRDGDMDHSKEWKDSVDFEDDLWVFQPGGLEKAALIIDFHRDGGSLVADLYDDQDGNGTVGYKVEGGRPVITESQYPTVRVIAKDGWWTQGAKTNFNLDILIDGKVRGDFVSPPYIDQLKSDGGVDFEIQVPRPGRRRAARVRSPPGIFPQGE